MSELEKFIHSFTDPSELRAALMETDALGETCLHHYAIEGDAEAVALILKAGVDINAQTHFGSTPLACAAGLDNTEEVVALLIQHGADISVRDSTGHTVMDNLMILGQRDRIAFIRSLMKDRPDH
jgi:ankyrin repeat protein